MLTIEPPAPSRIISLAVSCIRKNGALRLTAIIRSKSSGVRVQQVPLSVSAAAFTRTSIRPNRSSASAVTLHVFDKAEVGSDEMHRRAGRVLDLARHGATVCGIAPAGDNSGGAGPGEDPGDRRAETLCAARNDGDHSIDPVHRSTLYPAAAITRSNSAWPFFAMASGGLTAGSCSASTTNQPS